jgi:hypothetical protein
MRLFVFTFRTVALLVALSLVPPLALSQTRTSSEASLRVNVVDPSGAAVVGARIRLVTAGGREHSGETDSRGETVFLKLDVGVYELQVEAKGFETRDIADGLLKPGTNRSEVRLQVAGVKEEVDVKQHEREKASDPRGNTFTTVLTPEQIAALPDDPEEFEAAIRNMAGPGATLRVNGFRGGKLPPKSQIREIRFRMNPYAAESHESGFMSIDVFTKPGLESWHGSVNFGFRDEALNARNPFASVLGPEQLRRFGVNVDGPLWKNHTSLFLSADGSSNFDSKTIVAALPDGPFRDLVRRPSRTLSVSARVEHALDKTHTLRGEYQRNAGRLDNLGVGDFDLPERAFSTDRAEHILRVSDSGVLAKRFVNEVRFQASWQSIDSRSSSDRPAITVLNAFNRGGTGIDSSRRVRELEFADNLDFTFEKHAMRAGILLEASSYHLRELRNGNGTFVFASLDDFRNNKPTTFSRRSGDPRVEFSQYQIGWYWQDDMRVRKDLSVSFGLRHEFQTNLGDHNNFAPRFGITWSPFKDGKTTIRGGGGVFYDWFSGDTFEQTLRVDGSRQTDLVVSNPCFPDPVSCGTEIILPASRLQSDPRLRMPYVQQVSVGVQRQLSKFGQVFANYFHQRGMNQFRGHNINAPLPGQGRPDPSSGNINQVESTARSTVDGLSINVNLANPQRRFFAAIGYFLSKVTNESDGPFSLPADNFDFGAERGPGPGDIRHRVFGMVNMGLFKGLRLGTTFNASSAAPYNITTGFDDNGDSVSNDRPRGVTRNSVRGAGQLNLSTRLSWGFGWGQPRAAATMGQRAVVIRARDDSDVLGQMPMGGGPNGKRWRAELYVQAYNVLNHTNKTNFTGVQTSPFFGRATSALPARRIESGLRLSF